MAEQQPVIKSKQGRVRVEGAELDVVISDFDGRVFLLITECCKMGTLLDVSQDLMVDPSSSPTYSVRTLLGKDDPQVHVFGRALASQLRPPGSSLLLALGIRNPSPRILPRLLKELEPYTNMQLSPTTSSDSCIS